jgi:sugar-specific transcriptional regulator TrmB
MARPTKYTPENIEIILQAIRDSGIEAKGYRAINLSEEQYHAWKREKPQFSELVATTLDEFRKSHTHELNLAHEYLLRCLAGTEKITTKRLQVKKDKAGNVLEEIATVEEKSVLPPDWLVAKLYGHLRVDQQQDFTIKIELAQPEPGLSESLDDDEDL